LRAQTAASVSGLLAQLGDTRVTDRELGALYAAWKRADRAGRQRIVDEPRLFLKAWAATQAERVATDHAAAGSLLKDLTTLAALAWRAQRRATDDGGPPTAATTRAHRAARDAFAALGAHARGAPCWTRPNAKPS
jgi:hypothetical protein